MMPDSKRFSVKTRTTEIWLAENGIMHVKTFVGTMIDLADMEETMTTQLGLTGGRAVPILLDMRQMQSSTREAREYAAKNSSRTSLCVAILVESVMSRFFGNLFINFNKPDVPTQLFTSEEAALNWLRQFQETNRK